MLTRKTRLVSCLIAGTLALGIGVSYYSAEAQGPAQDHQATSEMVNQHVHSMVVTDQHLKDLISSTNDIDTVTLQTSQEFNGNPKDGGLHSHQVRMNKQQMQVLAATGEIDVECEQAAGHKHIVRFYKPIQCPMTYPQPYPPQACPYGGKCKYPYPYPRVSCPPPCTTCQYPYPYPTYCPTCPPPKPCPTCPPLPPPTYTSPVPTTTASPSPSLSPAPSGSPSPTPSLSPTPTGSATPAPSASVTTTASASPSVTPTTAALPGTAGTPSAGPSSGCQLPGGTLIQANPGRDCECAQIAKFPSSPNFDFTSPCYTNCKTTGTPCFCQVHPTDPSCPGPKSGCNPKDLACICNAQPWALACTCYRDPTNSFCRPQDCNPSVNPDCLCVTNPRDPSCGFIGGGASTTPSGSPLPFVASPGVTETPSASATPSQSPSPSPTATPTESPSPSPLPTPTSTCDIPGTDCYCGIQGPSDPNCTVSCSTPGTTCYCNFTNPQDPVCPGGVAAPGGGGTAPGGSGFSTAAARVRSQ